MIKYTHSHLSFNLTTTRHIPVYGGFAESFIVHLHTKEGPEIKDLNGTCPPSPRKTVSRSHDHSLPLVDG